jgi:hypothetical protein
VAVTVTWEESHAATLDRPERYGGRGLPVGGLDLHLFDVVEERVEARPPQDPYVGSRFGHADFSVLPEELFSELDEPESLLEVDSDLVEVDFVFVSVE